MGFLLSHAHSTQGDLWDVARKKCCLLNFGIVLDWTWMSVLWWRLLCPSSTSRYTGLIYGDSTILPIFFKKNWQYALVSKLYRGVPLFRNLILSKSSYARSNFKKKKKSIELDFREIDFQNATIRLKNITIGLLEPGMGWSHL